MPAYTGEQLHEMKQSGYTYRQLEQLTGRDREAVRGKIKSYLAGTERKIPHIAESSYPQYTSPLQMEGDAACIFDLEAPFHNADFLNRVFDLCGSWRITQAIFGGDCVHFDLFSSHGPSWQAPKPVNSITEDKERQLRELAQSLPPEYQGALIEQINSLTDTPMEDEIGEAARVLQTIAQVFERSDYVLGNHDTRFLRALEAPLAPAKLLDFLKIGDNPKWRIAPYYHGILISGGETFQVEHPASAASSTPVKLADKYERHIIAGHSHLLSFQLSTSGRYYAIFAGHTVDESRLPYTLRHTNRPAHALGAVIVRDGIPWLLHERSDWRRLARI